MNSYLTVFLGAGIGGALRHAINQIAAHWSSAFPVGTLTVNVVGSFLMGVAVVFFAARGESGSQLTLFFATGLLGGFTTFSAFSLESAMFAEKGDMATVALYIALSVGLSVGALLAGLAVARSALG